jgi:putative protease
MRNKPFKGELLAPAGGFAAGVHALRSGADAVYLGLSAFSARRGAKNFTLDEFSRLKALAEGLGKRVYAALNTVIKDSETAAAAALLYDLEALETDGIIVQDLGILDMIRKNFPRLAVHASTQMGVHNSGGIEFLESLGVRRVILSRELTLEEIGRIRAAHPGTELEVFIHGALCYSFSGLCLASGMLLGRSGNRGECAQICRGWFETDTEDSGGPETGLPRRGAHLPRRGYYFSCNDLSFGEKILRLRDLGIDSFKIEGRMKPPEWTAAVSSYYRALLDGLPPEEAAAHAEMARLLFSRRRTRGFIDNLKGEDLLNSGYPGHLGVPAGRVLASRPGAFLLRPERDLAVRDGLLYFLPAGDGGFPGDGEVPPRPVQFAITGLEIRGKRTVSARAGEEAWITCEEPPPAGTEVRQVSSHKSRLQEISGDLPKKTLPVRIHGEVSAEELILTLTPGNGLFPPVSCSQASVPQPARTKGDFGSILKKYCSPPGDSRFSAGEISFGNRTTLPGDGIFVNPSALKELRRKAYAALEASYLAGRESRAREAVGRASNPSSNPPSPAGGISPASVPEAGPGLPEPAGRDHPPAPSRPPRREAILDPASGLPFIADPGNLDFASLPRPEKNGPVYMALCPVLFDETAYFSALETALRGALNENPGLRVTMGLGNVGHLAFARALADLEKVDFFADYGLYIANRRAFELIASSVPRLRFYYPWIEDPAALSPEPEGTELPTGDYGAFEPPLFISRVCVWKHAGAGTEGGVSGCGDPGGPDSCRNCSGRGEAVVRQGNRKFLLRSVRTGGDCLNLLFRVPGV